MWKKDEFLKFDSVFKWMEIGIKDPGAKGRRMEVESYTILTKASFMKAGGWMEMQNVGLYVIWNRSKQRHQKSIWFHRYTETF